MLSDTEKPVELPLIVLASGSPRRSEILNSVGWQFIKDVPDIDESEIDGEPPDKYVLRLAEEKARVVAARHPSKTVLAADTTVVIDGIILGKPTDLDDARRMIRMISGVWHEVLTGVSIARDGKFKTDLQTTRVKFAAMSEAEIDFLACEGSPFDKAGAYAVQAQAALFIEAVEGEYWNVVGLPIQLVYSLIKSLD